MRKTRFTEEQMVAILKEQETGSTVDEIIRRHSISKQTLYKWKQKFGNMEATDVKKMRELEDENSRLKRIVANQAIEIEAIKEVLKKKW
jgi:putative transposase